MSTEILYDKDRCPVFGHAFRIIDPPDEPRKLCCINCGLEQPEPKKEKPMAKSTHWIHERIDMDSLPESMRLSPKDAAWDYLSNSDHSLENWDDKDQLTTEGPIDIKLIGLMETTEAIEDPDEQFDGYEPGQMWYKKTGEKATVRVSLKFEVIDSTVEKFGGGG